MPRTVNNALPKYRARSVVDLRECFPEGRDGKRSPLPKQQQFLEAALGDKYKFIRYSGGVGSGKTIIGCITMIHMAVLKSGDYLISRQFMPELKDTTYKTFKELLPPELIVEDRIADMIIKIRAQDGKISNILFRGLEEPDKLRSLNLNAAYIDEAAQVSEAAFLLLQGRLRGSAFRKIIITQNPGGHDWAYRWWIKQDNITSQAIKDVFLNIRAPSLENVHLPDGYVDTMMASWSKERIQREIMGSDDAFEGMVFNEFDRSVHVIKPFAIPKEWTRVAGVDHGYRNAASWVFGAVDYDGTVYIYKEYYQKERLIKEICSDVKKLIGTETIEQARIDPSTRARRGTAGRSDYDEYLDYLPAGFPLLMAQNDVTAGIDRVKTYLKADSKTGKPRVYIFDTCINLIEEATNYRYDELSTQRMGKMNEKEAPKKVNDHAVDAWRYLMMTRPETVAKREDVYKKINYVSLEGALYRELKELKGQKGSKDPFGM